MSSDFVADTASSSAVAYALPDWTCLEVAGPDARSFLHNFCTSDIKKLPAGGACETFFTNVKARVVAHGFVLDATTADAAPRFFVFGTPGQAAALLAHLDRYLVREDVTLLGRSDTTFATLLTGLTAETGPAVIEQFAAIGGQAWLCGLLEPFDVVALTASPLALPAGVVAGDAEAFESLRIAAQFPRYGHDVTDQHLAPEVGRPWAINYRKGCYLGQEPIARIDALGHVNRLLRGLTVSGDAPIAVGAAVQVDGAEVGRVTSAAGGPGGTVALGYLKTKFAAPGMRVTVETPHGDRAATVAEPLRG